jgi:hypothetical protein
MENFDLSRVKSLSQIEAIAYIKQYFFPLDNGNHAMYVNGKYEQFETKVIKSTYFNRMSKELNDFYFHEYTDIKSITYQFGKDVIIGNQLNMCPKMKVQYKHKFDEYDETTKTGVNVMLNFIKEVLADNNEESYNYLLKWFANMLQGNKNDSCLYLKGQQGIGKSTICEFLKEFVIGLDLMLETGSEPLKNKFNSILGGKLLVVFEELENFSVNEWSAVSSVLKRYITSSTYQLESKNINPYQANNMNNYIINSNNDAIKDDDGRRYFILDVSHKYMKDTRYFGNLRKQCFNNLVGEAFYAYITEIDTKDFIPQQYPDTNAKLNAHAKRLDKVYEFVKNIFILNNQAIKHTAKELYELYDKYCTENNNKKLDKTSFAEKLKQVGIEYKKSNGNNWYKYSFEQLKVIGDKHKWIHELDEVQSNLFVEAPESNDVVTTLQLTILEKNNEIAELKLRIAELEAKQNPKVENVIEAPTKKYTRKIIKKPALKKDDWSEKIIQSLELESIIVPTEGEDLFAGF